MATRRQNRRSVRLDAALRVGNDLIVGSVLDVSSLGAFFRPEAGFVGGVFTQLFEPPDILSPTAVVGLEIGALEDDAQTGFSSRATVRWSGFSSRHSCAGIGLEFENQAVTLG